MEKEQFKHKYSLKVQFHEVDLLGVCNNAVYFNFFETARIEYLKAIGHYEDMTSLASAPNYYLMVHNECDYLEPALYDDILNVFTRISYIKNSSYGFEHVIENENTGRIITKGGGAFVFIDRNTGKSTPLPEAFYSAVKAYEANVQIMKR